MFGVAAHPLPARAFLARYHDRGAYTDCFATGIARPLPLGEFIEAFYTTWLFRAERAVLARFFACPSSDAEVVALAAGTTDRFAAWTVEVRAADQILLRDLREHTCSWLMIAPAGGATRLYFGSAIVPAHPGRAGNAALGGGFRALLGLHLLYSRALLGAARRRLRAGPDAHR